MFLRFAAQSPLTYGIYVVHQNKFIWMQLFCSSKRVYGHTSMLRLPRFFHAAAPHHEPQRRETSSRSNTFDNPSSANAAFYPTARILPALIAHITTSSTTRPANPLHVKPAACLNLYFQNPQRSTLNPSFTFLEALLPLLPPVHSLHSTSPLYISFVLQHSQVRRAE